MKKRAMSLLLALVMMLALLPAQTWATDTVDEPGEAEEQTMPAEPQKEALKAEKTAEAPQVQAEAVTSGTCGAEGDGSNLTWSLSGGVLTISGTGAMKDWEFYGNNVSPWCENEQITGIVINDGVTSVGDGAFYQCKNVTNVKLPDTLKSIGYLAFYSCFGLKAVDIPNGVTSLTSAFQNCRSLTTIDVPSSVTDIGGAFATCVSLTNVTLPEGLTGIGKNAFASCERLTSIKIPSTVTSIGSYAFDDTAIRTIDIPNGVTEIGERAFGQCPNLTELVIPDSVVKIGLNVVEGCSKLRSIYIGKNVTSLFETFGGYGSFQRVPFADCSALATITVNKDNQSYTAVDNVLFDKEMKQLIRCAPAKTGSYSLPASVTSIYWREAFADSQLTDITIHEGVTVIPKLTFMNSAVRTVILPKTLTKIYESAFKGCTNLTSIAIPEGIENIEAETFYNCTSLARVTLPNSLRRIYSEAFSGCTGLGSIVIPEGTWYIANHAFFGCTAMAYVGFPKTITSIEEAAFLGCENLKDVYYKGTETEWKEVARGWPIEGDPLIKLDTIFHFETDAPATPLLPGCPTGGDKVQIQDVAFVYEFLIGQKQGDDAVKEGSAQWNAMNVNGDETVDVYDLQMIYEMACGLQ